MTTKAFRNGITSGLPFVGDGMFNSTAAFFGCAEETFDADERFIDAMAALAERVGAPLMRPYNFSTHKAIPDWLGTARAALCNTYENKFANLPQPTKGQIARVVSQILLHASSMDSSSSPLADKVDNWLTDRFPSLDAVQEV